MIRDAESKDGEALARLIGELGYDVTAEDVSCRLALLAGQETPAILWDEGGPLGCLTWNVMPVLHRPTPVGRISLLVVDERMRGRGIGKALVAEAERRLARAGCALIEVSSNRRRAEAHLFYERLGFERTSFRFGKTLEPAAH